MSGRLEGRTVAVLGASGCHGAAAARALANEGASLVLGARSREPLESLQRELEETRTLVVGTDVTRRHHLERLVEVAVEGFGGLDALVYAARARPASLANLEADAWESSVDVNLRGFLYAVGAALPVLLEGGGHVVDLGGAPEDHDALGRGAASARRVALEELHSEHSNGGVTFSEAYGAESLLCSLTRRR